MTPVPPPTAGPGVLDNVPKSVVPAFIVAARVGGKAGVRDLARRSFRWRVPLRWYLISLRHRPLPQTAAQHRARLRQPQSEPRIPPIHPPRTHSGAKRMALDLRSAQHAEAQADPPGLRGPTRAGGPVAPATAHPARGPMKQIHATASALQISPQPLSAERVGPAG